MLWTCVPRLGQRVKVCTAHPTAGTRLDPGAEESRTPSTDTTGNSRQAGVVVRHDVGHNSELRSYSPTLLFAFRPRHASAERNFLLSGHRKVASACGDRYCPVSPSAASSGDEESRGSRQVPGPTCAGKSDAAKGSAAGIFAVACARCNWCRGRRWDRSRKAQKCGTLPNKIPKAVLYIGRLYLSSASRLCAWRLARVKFA